MTIDDLKRFVAAQEPLVVVRDVRVMGPILSEAVKLGRIRRLDLIEAHPDQTTESRTFRYGHVLGSPCVESAAIEWQRQHPQFELPADLLSAIRQVNGIHLWADLDTGRAYFGISPLCEWQEASGAQWEDFAQGSHGLALSYHANGDYYLVYDATQSEYRWYDMEDYSGAQTVARTFDQMLDWFWKEAQSRAPSGTTNS